MTGVLWSSVCGRVQLGLKAVSAAIHQWTVCFLGISRDTAAGLPPFEYVAAECEFFLESVKVAHACNLIWTSSGPVFVDKRLSM
jgi:hypothetical protein